jgi:hypothetical protein
MDKVELKRQDPKQQVVVITLSCHGSIFSNTWIMRR